MSLHDNDFKRRMGKDVEGINHDPSQNLPGEHGKIAEYFSTDLNSSRNRSIGHYTSTFDQ
jgi:hypothetical protein